MPFYKASTYLLINYEKLYTKCLFILKVLFEDVLAEPDGAHAIDCVWRNSFKCFNCGKNCCYKFMTTLCGICIGLGWGCEFAMITFNMVWCITPMLRVLSILLGCAQKFFGSLITCCFAPVCETFGLCFSKIAISNIKHAS